jgi:small subunit ribosomal protein S5
VADRRTDRADTREAVSEFEERVVCINRYSKVVKGGRNFHFSALVVVGDRNGRVGVGFGKANEVSDAIRKGSELAKKAVVRIPMKGSTLTHRILSEFRGARVVMRPASEGTGIIAGGGMRAVLELGGVRDVLAKSLGSKNPVNVVKATMKGISMLRTRDEILAKRDISSL